MIPQQIAAIMSENKNAVVTVLSADTDVFVLLCFHLWKYKWHSTKQQMDTFSDGKDKLISITNTVEAHKLEMKSLIGLHALCGCDTVAMMFGIGKAKALKAVKDAPLSLLGEKDVDIEKVMQEATVFVSRCYGQCSAGSSEKRKTIYKRKTDSAKKSARPPALKSLPPTDEALKENIKRAHLTAALWKNCAPGSLPPMSPCDYGWEKIENVLILVMLPSNTQFAPDEVLNTTHCKGIKQKCSKSSKCSCVSIGVKCNPQLCACVDCENTQKIALESDSDSESEVESDVE